MMQAASTQRQGATAPSSAHPSVFGIMLRPSCGARDTVACELGQYRATALAAPQIVTRRRNACTFSQKPRSPRLRILSNGGALARRRKMIPHRVTQGYRMGGGWLIPRRRHCASVAHRPAEHFKAPTTTTQRALGASNSVPRVAPSRLSPSPLPVVFATGLVTALVAGWLNRDEEYLVPGSGTGYWLGVAGAAMMLLLLLYPLRKRVRFARMDRLGGVLVSPAHGARPPRPGARPVSCEFQLRIAQQQCRADRHADRGGERRRRTLPVRQDSPWALRPQGGGAGAARGGAGAGEFARRRAARQREHRRADARFRAARRRDAQGPAGRPVDAAGAPDSAPASRDAGCNAKPLG